MADDMSEILCDYENYDHASCSFLQLNMDDSTFQSYYGTLYASYGFSLIDSISCFEAQTYGTTCSTFGNPLHLLSNINCMHSGVVFCGLLCLGLDHILLERPCGAHLYCL